MFDRFAYDHQLAFYGEPSPRLVELLDRIGVNVTRFSILQTLEAASVH